jgi:hypothetical protein
MPSQRLGSWAEKTPKHFSDTSRSICSEEGRRFALAPGVASASTLVQALGRQVNVRRPIGHRAIQISSRHSRGTTCADTYLALLCPGRAPVTVMRSFWSRAHCATVTYSYLACAPPDCSCPHYPTPRNLHNPAKTLLAGNTVQFTRHGSYRTVIS